jgi:predicted nucleic acid-binding protein
MNVVDSSGWLEFVADGPGADFFEKAISDKENLIVPMISVYEVYKRLYQETGKDIALQTIAYMQSCQLVDLEVESAMQSAEFSATNKVPMADSIIYTTALNHQATLWTQDKDLKGFDGVQFQEKKK